MEVIIMPLTLDQICNEAILLPNDTKASLVEKLVASIEANVDPNLEKLHIRQAIRRRDEIRQGKVQPIPGKEGMAKVKAMAKK